MCHQIGAASGYPQSFLSVDKETEKNKIVKKSMKKFKLYAEYLNPIYFFPAGGTYLISGKFVKLNRYVSQLSVKDLKTLSLTSNLNLQYIEGGNQLVTEETPRANSF